MKTIKEAIAHAKSLVGKAAPGGPGHCQEFVRECYGLPAWATSAKLAWEKIPADKKHHTPITEAPEGAMVYFATLSDYGHVVLSAGGGKCFTNDYCVRAQICETDIRLPSWHGEQHYSGWSMWTPNGEAK